MIYHTINPIEFWLIFLPQSRYDYLRNEEKTNLLFSKMHKKTSFPNN